MDTPHVGLAEHDAVDDQDGSRLVHVRINVGGDRIIGWVELPAAPSARCSGVLNDPNPYLTVRRDSPSAVAATELVAVAKEAISYVEVVGEPTTRAWMIPGTFQPVVIELAHPAVTLRGEVFVLVDTAVVDLLNDGRRFVNVRNAQLVDRCEAYRFLAVGKAQTRAVHF